MNMSKKRKKGLRKHIRARERGRQRRQQMKQLLVEYIRTGNYALLADIKKKKGK